jgi:glycosyltransferase involved in cell wall biosynthesis
MPQTRTQSPPILSICIPTYDRAEILDFGLERLRAIEKFDRAIEIVVSDNKPTEATAKVIEKHRAWKPDLKYCLQTVKRVSAYVGYINAIRNASGRYVTFMADDDALDIGSLLGYVNQLDSDHRLSAVFPDWIAYDDDQEREIHRYWNLDRSYRFGPSNPLALVEFVLQRAMYPDMGVYRRESILRCDCLLDRGGYQFHLWMYQLSRLGDISFEPRPYYYENRILKKRFVRAGWGNMAMRLEFIGDEQRSILETILLWAIQDSGGSHVDETRVCNAKRLIDGFLHAKLTVEVQRAIAEKNWLLALALRRRMVLWHGPGNEQQQRIDAVEIAIPAALHSVYEMTQSLSDVSALVLEAFTTQMVHNFFNTHFPQLKVLDASAEPPASGRYLYLARNAPTVRAADDGYHFYLDELLVVYRVNALRFDLSGL